jgi:hypothetical protein
MQRQWPTAGQPLNQLPPSSIQLRTRLKPDFLRSKTLIQLKLEDAIIDNLIELHEISK